MSEAGASPCTIGKKTLVGIAVYVPMDGFAHGYLPRLKEMPKNDGSVDHGVMLGLITTSCNAARCS